MEITREFAKMISKTRYKDFSEEDISIAKERVLDTLGAWIAGFIYWDFTKQLIETCELMGHGHAGIIGCSDQKYTSAVAAMANTCFAHAMELDDGHKNAGVHAGAVVIPTAFTLGAELNSSIKDIITSIILGYEIIYRIAVNINPAQLKKGFHPSATCGTFGAMAVSSKLMGLKEDQCANGLGLAGLFTSGLMEAIRSGSQTKCIMVGKAASNGIYAAKLAAHDIVGPLSVFEGTNGMFSAMSENVNDIMVTKDLGKEFLIKDTYTKLYPACRHSHAAIESTIQLINKKGIKPEDIKKIEVSTYKLAKESTGKIFIPKDAGEAKFSLPYCLAVAIYEKYFGICHLNDHFLGQKIYQEMAKRVIINVNSKIDDEYPKVRASKVNIVLKNGNVFSKYLSHLKGSPDNPISWKRLLVKFTKLVNKFLSNQNINDIVELVEHLEQVDYINLLSYFFLF